MDCSISLLSVVSYFTSNLNCLALNFLNYFSSTHFTEILVCFELLLARFWIWSHRRHSSIKLFFELNQQKFTNARQQATALVCSLSLQISQCIQQFDKNSLNLRFPPFLIYLNYQGVNGSVEMHLMLILSEAYLQRPAHCRHKNMASSVSTNCFDLRPHQQQTVLNGSSKIQVNLASNSCQVTSDFQFYIYQFFINLTSVQYKLHDKSNRQIGNIITYLQVKFSNFQIDSIQYLSKQQKLQKFIIKETMNQESSIVKPLFHYSYRNQGTILDQQYNYQGNILAVANSNGDIILYSANNEEQNRERIFCYDRKKGNERKYAVMKISWSLPIFGLFAAATINRDIELYQCKKNAIALLHSIRLSFMPLSLAFCPIQFEVILAVGTSKGAIILLSQTLTQIGSVVAHQQGVTCLAWDHKILSFQKNRWIMNNFSHIHRYVQSEQMPHLISGSSDQTIKIWRKEGNKLIEMFKIKAHLKAVRDIQWRNTYLQSDKFIISCSEDGTVKIWKVKGTNDKITDLQLKQSRSFGGPVYKANFNFLGNLIAISFCNEVEQKVETIIMKQKNGAMMGEQIKIHV